jgi:hypothetical protein
MKNVANMPVMSRPRMTLELGSPGMAKTRSGMIGLRSRHSSATKAPSRASDAAAKPSVCAEPQPCELAVTIA